MDLLIQELEWGQRTMANEKEYIYVDSSNVEHKVALTKDDFALARKVVLLVVSF